MPDILKEDLEDICYDEFFHELAGKTFLITGITGLLGSLTAKACMLFNNNTDNKEKIKVIGLIRNKKKAQELFAEFENTNCLSFAEADLLSDNFLEIEEDIDYIIHTASMTASKLFVTQPVETIETIYSGTKKILELAKGKKCKSVVYLSSMEMYGKTDPAL